MDVSTRLQRIAELARKYGTRPLTTLAHLIDVEFLREAFRRTRKDGAAGVDGQTASEYEERLDVYEDYLPDTQAADVSAETRALADVCLLYFNSNRFIYVY